MIIVNSMNCEDEGRIIGRLTTIGIGGNVILSIFKLLAGIICNSAGMISDAAHSLSDVFATAIAFVGAKISRKGMDHEHPYVHERIECVASQILSIILIITAVGIMYSAITSITNKSYVDSTPTLLPLIAAIVSIAVKEGMFWYTMHYAKVIDSDAFSADAWHHRSDALSSIGALIGISLAMVGFPIADPIASIVISLFILKVAWGILNDSYKKMLDTSCDDETENSLRVVICSVNGVKSIDSIHTRLFGNRIYVDVEIGVDSKITVEEGHRIAEEVHDRIEKEFSKVKHVMVHVNPF